MNGLIQFTCDCAIPDCNMSFVCKFKAQPPTGFTITTSPPSDPMAEVWSKLRAAGWRDVTLHRKKMRTFILCPAHIKMYQNILDDQRSDENLFFGWSDEEEEE